MISRMECSNQAGIECSALYALLACTALGVE
jgi:hypothetical protein